MSKNVNVLPFLCLHKLWIFHQHMSIHPTVTYYYMRKKKRYFTYIHFSLFHFFSPLLCLLTKAFFLLYSYLLSPSFSISISPFSWRINRIRKYFIYVCIPTFLSFICLAFLHRFKIKKMEILKNVSSEDWIFFMLS